MGTGGKGLTNEEIKSATTLFLSDGCHFSCLEKSLLCLVTQSRVSSPGCLILVLYSEHGSCTFLTGQGKTGPSAPEPKQGKDLLSE